MKSLRQFIQESLEDGKYVDLPTTDLYRVFPATKPNKKDFRGYEKSYQDALDKYKAAKKDHDNAWKEHINLVKKVDDENMEILIDKIMKFLNDKAHHEDFIKAEIAKTLESIKNSNRKDGKSYAEEELVNSVNRVKRALLAEETQVGFDWVDTMEEDIYKAVSYIARKYGIDTPKFSDIHKGMIARTADDFKYEYEEEHGSSHRNEKQAEKNWQKFKEQAKKDKETVKKFREQWMKTDQYAKLAKLADMYEDDVEKILKAVDRAYTRFDVLNGKDKEWNNMCEKMIGHANKALKSVFGKYADEVSCYGVSLIDILITVGLNGDENPKIEVVDKGTTSWLAGMKNHCKFKVTDKDGNEYTSGTYEDRGLDGGADGFGAYD